MTTRISKLCLPYPMPASFAHELAGLVLGPVAPTYQQAFITSQTLLVAWTAGHALTLIDLYRRQTPPMPLLIEEFMVHAVRTDGDTAMYEDVLATLTATAQMLAAAPNADHVFVDLAQQVGVRWSQALRDFNSRPAAADTLRDLVGRYAEHSRVQQPLGAVGLGSESIPAPGGNVTVIDLRGGGADASAFLSKMLSDNTPAAAAAKPFPASQLQALAAIGKPSIQLFDPASAHALVQRMPAPTNPLEANNLQRQLLVSMVEDSGRRCLQEVPEGDPLADLYQRFPHFSDVLDLVNNSLALAGCGTDGRPVYVPPVLLRGTAGTGKTYFAQELARVLKLHFVERDLSVTSEAFVLVGMDAAWKNSKPGIVFDALVHGQSANPLILLDELDKVAVMTGHNSPMQALYALLEPTSAAIFSDEFIPLKLDASRVNWILTANQAFVPDPILTRLEVFDIREPTQDQCRQIAASVWARVCATRMPAGHGFSAEMSDDVLDYMSKCTPRVMRKMLTFAAGHAVLAKRRVLLLDDLKLSARRYTAREKVMGFVAS